MCTILDSIIKETVVKFIYKHNLKSTQPGFCKNKSCVTNLIEFYYKSLQQLDSTKALNIIYLDIKKAFNKVPMTNFILKVRDLGITKGTSAISSKIGCK